MTSDTSGATSSMAFYAQNNTKRMVRNNVRKNARQQYSKL